MRKSWWSAEEIPPARPRFSCPAFAKHVYLLVRREGLGDTMSRYLISRIEACKEITFEAVDRHRGAGRGVDHLERVRWRNTQDRTRKRLTISITCF